MPPTTYSIIADSSLRPEKSTRVGTMSRRKIAIGSKIVGEGEPCFVIAEVGLAHEGSLGCAFAYVDAVADAGADAVKFQTHLAEFESTAQESFRVPVFPQDRLRRDYWERTAFSEEEWTKLRKHADSRGLVFMSSPFSVEAVRLLRKVGMAAWKIASGEVNNLPMLREIASTGQPVLMSTGMSRSDEIDEAVNVLRQSNAGLVLYQCTSRYPCPPEHLGLNMIAEYGERYGVPVGFSDHSGEPAVAVSAYSLGACSVEVHVTFSRKCFGPDVSSSLTMEELESMVGGIRFLEKAFPSPVDKEAEARDLESVRALFTKSLVAAADLDTGTVLAGDLFGVKKPRLGIPAEDVDKVIGKTLVRRKRKDDFVTWDDVE